MSKKMLKTAAIIGTTLIPGVLPVAGVATVAGVVGAAMGIFDETSLLDLNPQETEFRLIIMYAAAIIDGEINEYEKKLINKFILLFKPKIRIEDLQTMENIGFREIKERYEAIKKKNNELYLKDITDIIDADYKRSDIEKIFLYKCGLLFNNYPDSKLIYLSNDNVSSFTLDNIDVIDKMQIRNIYPDTEVNNSDKLFFINPYNPKELIPITEIDSQNILINRDYEIITAMRILGAKKLIIERREIEMGDFCLGVSMKEKGKEKKEGDNAGKVLNLKKGIKGEAEIKNDLSSENLKLIKFEFEGKKENIFLRKNFLKHTKWIKMDPELRCIVEALNSINSIKETRIETQNTKEYNLLFHADLAMECIVGNLSFSSAKINLETKYNSIKKFASIFVVEF